MTAHERSLVAESDRSARMLGLVIMLAIALGFALVVVAYRGVLERLAS